MAETPQAQSQAPQPRRGLLALWHETPLYARILGALGLGVAAGFALGEHAAVLAVPGQLALRLLAALAPPLILLAVVDALMKAQVRSRMGVRLAYLLLLNTLVAIFIGLLVANILGPGRWARIEPPPAADARQAVKDPLTLFLDNVPRSLLGPLGDEGKVLGVIVIAVAFGIALRRL